MKNRFPVYAFLAVAVALTACSKANDYKKFQQGGEISYPGIIESVQVRAGKNRLFVSGLITSDPKITKARMFWNSRQDSIELPILRKGGVDTVKTLISNLKEGAISIEIRTYDAEGHRSIPVFVVGNNYGAQYEQGISNRSATSINVTGSGLNITWLAAAMTSPFSKLTYTAADGTVKNLRVLPEDETTLLPDYKYGSPILVNSAYLPEATAFDTFYTAKADTLRKENALAGVYTSSGTRINHTGPSANGIIASTTVLSGDKTATELNARQVEVDYANLGGSLWKYIFTLDNNTITVAPNSTLAAGIIAGSFKVLNVSYNNISKTINVKTEYTNTAGDARVVDETLTLK